jgi:hypothetical protein
VNTAFPFCQLSCKLLGISLSLDLGLAILDLGLAILDLGLTLAKRTQRSEYFSVLKDGDLYQIFSSKI